MKSCAAHGQIAHYSCNTRYALREIFHTMKHAKSTQQCMHTGI